MKLQGWLGSDETTTPCLLSQVSGTGYFIFLYLIRFVSTLCGTRPKSRSGGSLPLCLVTRTSERLWSRPKAWTCIAILHTVSGSPRTGPSTRGNFWPRRWWRPWRATMKPTRWWTWCSSRTRCATCKCASLLAFLQRSPLPSVRPHWGIWGHLDKIGKAATASAVKVEMAAGRAASATDLGGQCRVRLWRNRICAHGCHSQSWSWPQWHQGRMGGHQIRQQKAWGPVFPTHPSPVRSKVLSAHVSKINCPFKSCSCQVNGIPRWLSGKESPASAGDTGSIPGSRRSPGEGNATHSSILAWEIPWTEEPGGLQSVGSQRIRHDLVTEHALSAQAIKWTMENGLQTSQTVCTDTWAAFTTLPAFYNHSTLPPAAQGLQQQNPLGLPLPNSYWNLTDPWVKERVFFLPPSICPRA